MAAVECDALCLRVWDWSETSQTAALFTRETGLTRVLAKGSKRPRSVFSGGLEALTRGEAGVIHKPTTELALLTRWDLVETFPAVRKSLSAHRAGLYLAELLLSTMALSDAHPRLYDAGVRSLRALETPEHVWWALAGAQWAAMVETGHRPTLDQLVPSGEPRPTATAYTFDPELGGLTGALEAGNGSEAKTIAAGNPIRGVDWRLRATTLEALHRIDRELVDGSTDPQVGDSIHRAARFLAAYVRHVLGGTLTTQEAVFPDLGGGSHSGTADAPTGG